MKGPTRLIRSRIAPVFLLCALSSAQTTTELANTLSRGEFGEAVRSADVILRRHPEDARIWTLRAIALGRMGKTSESPASFRHALDISPSYLPALRGAAEVAYSQHDPSAPDVVRRLLSKDPGNAIAHAMSGALAAESHDCRTAVAEFGSAGSVIQSNADALVQYGDCLLAEDRPEDAAGIYRRLLTMAPGNVAARYRLALSLRRANKIPAAIELLNGLPPDSKALNLLAECYIQQKEPASAVNALRRAIQIAPTDEQNYVDLGVLYIEQKEPRSAVETANEGLRQLPDSARIHAIRGAAYTWLNDPQRAAEDFDKADQFEPEQLYGSVGLSMLFRQNEHLPDAIRILRNKLAERPDDPTLNYLLADTLVRTGAEPGQPSFDEALALLKKSTALDPKFQKAQLALGKLYLRASLLDDAVRQFRIGTELDPNDRSALNQLILLLRQTGKNEEASAAAAKLRTLIAADRKSNPSPK